MTIYTKMIAITAASAILALTAQCAMAETGDTWINLHLGSHHDTNQWFDDNGNAFDFNESNYGAGVIHEWIDHLDVRAGAFRNSFDHTSVYTGIGWHTSYQKPVSAALQVGIATGYKNTPTGGDSALVGYVMPTLGINFDRVRAEIGYIPSTGEDKSNVVTFSLSFKLK